jgi:hypothetical protein
MSNAIVHATEIALANARMALDQIDSPDYSDAVSSFAQNVRDTLIEKGWDRFTNTALATYYIHVGNGFSKMAR